MSKNFTFCGDVSNRSTCPADVSIPSVLQRKARVKLRVTAKAA
jgi:hypothetical protein